MGLELMMTGMGLAVSLGGQAGAPAFQAMLAEVLQANGKVSAAADSLDAAVAISSFTG